MVFLIIDGNSVMHRMFHAIRSLSNSSGQPTNAIYGFLNVLIKLQKELNPDFAAVAFDVKAPTFRAKMYDLYKANRKPTPDELISQFSKIKEILHIMGYKTIEQPGFEADDIIGTLAHNSSQINDLKTIIVTSDRDALQLVRSNVLVKLTSSKAGSSLQLNYDENTVLDAFSVTPQELIELKALMGDASDNIPGVKGIGQTTATKLISKYHSIEYIYDNLESLDEAQVLKNKLVSGKDSAFLSKKLALICNDVPIDTNIDSYKIAECDSDKLVEILSNLEMFSILKKLHLHEGTTFTPLSSEELSDFNSKAKPNDESNENLKLQNEKETLKQEKQELIDQVEQITFDCMFSSLKKNSDYKPITLSELESYLKLNLNYDVFLIPYKDDKLIINVSSTIFTFTSYLSVIELLFKLKLEGYSLKIFTHDSKKIHKMLLPKYSQTLDIKFDTQIASYLLNTAQKNDNLDELLKHYCNFNTDSSLKERVSAFQKLCKLMAVEIQNNSLSDYFYNFAIPISAIITEMETTGFLVNKDNLSSVGERLSDQISKLESEIFSISNKEINVNSPPQVSNLLFKELGLPSSNKKHTSTDMKSLEEIKHLHPVVEKILECRLLYKTKSTFVNGLIKELKPDGRLHPSFEHLETKTGRITTRKPNLQNIPIKSIAGFNFRKYFIAKKGCALIDADYSQIELRILAHLSNDKNMIDAFNNDQDIHVKTASEIFNVSTISVTPEMRKIAKSVNFGILYGISSFSLAQEVGISTRVAKQYIESYFNKFKDVKEYLDSVVQNAYKSGFVSTIAGRRRYIDELSSSNKILQAAGERIARNTPIQGSAADIITIAMVNINNRLKASNLTSQLILQVHDELIIESPIDELDQTITILTEEMQNAAKLSVPLVVNIGAAPNWFDAH